MWMIHKYIADVHVSMREFDRESVRFENGNFPSFIKTVPLKLPNRLFLICYSQFYELSLWKNSLNSIKTRLWNVIFQFNVQSWINISSRSFVDPREKLLLKVLNRTEERSPCSLATSKFLEILCSMKSVKRQKLHQ